MKEESVQRTLLALLSGRKGNHGTDGPLDGKPLEAIFQKPLLQAPVRLQRMLLRLQRYDISVQYGKGEKMYIADILSRLHPPIKDALKLDEVYQVDSIFKELESIQAADNANILQASLAKIKAETVTDESLCLLAATIKSGWPESKEPLPFGLHPFRDTRSPAGYDTLSIQNGIIFGGDQVVVPKSMRQEMMKKYTYAI